MYGLYTAKAASAVMATEAVAVVTSAVLPFVVDVFAVMIELNLKYLDEFNKDSEVKYTIDEARATMKEFFPQLKRWKK